MSTHSNSVVSTTPSHTTVSTNTASTVATALNVFSSINANSTIFQDLEDLESRPSSNIASPSARAVHRAFVAHKSILKDYAYNSQSVMYHFDHNAKFTPNAYAYALQQAILLYVDDHDNKNQSKNEACDQVFVAIARYPKLVWGEILDRGKQDNASSDEMYAALRESIRVTSRINPLFKNELRMNFLLMSAGLAGPQLNQFTGVISNAQAKRLENFLDVDLTDRETNNLIFRLYTTDISLRETLMRAQTHE